MGAATKKAGGAGGATFYREGMTLDADSKEKRKTATERSKVTILSGKAREQGPLSEGNRTQ